MPLYFFNYRLNGVLENDPEGMDLPSDDAALKEATSSMAMSSRSPQMTER